MYQRFQNSKIFLKVKKTTKKCIARFSCTRQVFKNIHVRAFLLEQKSNTKFLNYLTLLMNKSRDVWLKYR